MKNLNCLILVFLGVTGLSAAQKLPNKQETALRAPAKVKVDGDAAEWGDKFQAYNKATEVYYTMANNDGNLYLTVRATNSIIINKIMSGGISLAIDQTGKKNDKGTPSITFPVLEGGGRLNFGVINKASSTIGEDKAAVDRMESGKMKPNDSVAFAYNKRLGDNAKLVMVTGVKGIDTLISIYNDTGIKARQLFDGNMAYTYELAVPLKYLGLDIKNQQKFAYHITLNGNSILPKKNATAVNIGGGEGGILELKVMAFNQSSAPTDFWAEYTLAQK
ncbi:MAG: hypothetical protein V4553_14655 [Bacteroidota bacterium]